MQLPATITGTFQGTAQAFQSSLKIQPYLILAALVAVYIILGMLYESYIHPLTILSTLPSAGVGALLVLMVFHIDLSVMALIGIILLIGIVKKNGIMMVDFAIQAEREQHLSPRAAIRQACLLRFRPIMMTTMAALLGALPLCSGSGTGSELRQPLGLHDGRRPGGEPGADAVHDAGGLPVSGPLQPLARGAAARPRTSARAGTGIRMQRTARSAEARREGAAGRGQRTRQPVRDQGSAGSRSHGGSCGQRPRRHVLRARASPTT